MVVEKGSAGVGGKGKPGVVAKEGVGVGVRSGVVPVGCVGMKCE